MNGTYRMAYVEVIEILKHIPIEEYNKIPKEKLDFFEKNKDKEYNYKYDVKNPEISCKANAIIVKLYRDYISTIDEKEKIDYILELNNKKSEIEKEKKFDNNILEKQNKKSVDNIQNNEQFLANVKREKWYMKLINKIRKVFK